MGTAGVAVNLGLLLRANGRECTHASTQDRGNVQGRGKVVESANRDGPRRVGVRELRTHLTNFLRQAHDGQTFLVTSRDEVLAEIRPPRTAKTREPGALRGKISIASDFDATPREIVAAMEGEEG